MKEDINLKLIEIISINVRKGEVVGISGLMGAGRTEFAMSLFGKSYGDNISGQLFINGKEVHFNSVQEAIKHRLAYVTEDRKENGLILDEPTRGINVGAKYEIYCIINQLVAKGKSVIMISSELPEILGMCDRIYIMNEGKMVGELAGSDSCPRLAVISMR